SAPWSVTVNWGDNSNDSFTASKVGDLGTRPHAYSTTGSHTVKVTVTNSAGQAQFATFAVNTLATVHTAPVVTPARSQTAARGVSQTLNLGPFTDPDSGPYNVTVNWGDNSNTTFQASNAGDLGTKPHTYTTTGNHTVTVTVTNSAGQFDSKNFLVNTP